MDEKEIQALQEENARIKAELEAEKAEKAKLAKNVSDQNSYITKLEKDRQASTSNREPLDPATKAYLQKKMREDTIAGTLSKLTPQFPVGVVGAIREDLDLFLDKTMKPENTTEAYVREAFYLCYGKAMANKEHAVHQILAQVNPVTPVQQGAQIVPPGQPPAGPLPSERLQNIGKPPVLNPNPTQTPNDGGIVPPVIPGASGIQPANTQEALKSFKSRLGGLK